MTDSGSKAVERLREFTERLESGDVPPTTTLYRLRIWIERHDEGTTYSVYAADLPGCASHGDTIDECLANVREAFIGLAKSYRAAGVPIPWIPVADRDERPMFHEEMNLIVSVTYDH